MHRDDADTPGPHALTLGIQLTRLSLTNISAVTLREGGEEIDR